MGASPEATMIQEWIQLGCSENLTDLRERARQLASSWPNRYTLVIVRSRLTPRPLYSLMLRHGR